jgi:hypothetical protein
MYIMNVYINKKWNGHYYWDIARISKYKRREKKKKKKRNNNTKIKKLWHLFVLFGAICHEGTKKYIASKDNKQTYKNKTIKLVKSSSQTALYSFTSNFI